MKESRTNSTSYLSSLEKLFYFEMDEQTSACLFGSSLTNDWVAGRSDLDLCVIVHEEAKIEFFGEKIKEWHSNPANPILDGFVVYASAYGTMVREFHKFEKARYLGNFIQLIDLWNVKNRSKHLFGQDVTKLVQEISQEDLKDWAFKNIEDYWIPLLSDLSRGSPEAKIPLSALIFIGSGVARTLMLTEGNVCSSKREALRWFANEYIEIRESINVLLEEFEKPDNMAKTFTAAQASTLGRFYLNLLRLANDRNNTRNNYEKK